jgi:hypothetical protein
MSHFSKCKHDIYLSGCRECFPINYDDFPDWDKKMTANELADKLEEGNSVSWGNCTHEQHDNDKYFKEKASTMLRQQAHEIQAMKTMLGLNDYTFTFKIDLTDEEIMQVWQDSEWGDGEEEDILLFAKALLKKASEK